MKIKTTLSLVVLALAMGGLATAFALRGNSDAPEDKPIFADAPSTQDRELAKLPPAIADPTPPVPESQDSATEELKPVKRSARPKKLVTDVRSIFSKKPNRVIPKEAVTALDQMNLDPRRRRVFEGVLFRLQRDVAALEAMPEGPAAYHAEVALRRRAREHGEHVLGTDLKSFVASAGRWGTLFSGEATHVVKRY